MVEIIFLTLCEFITIAVATAHKEEEKKEWKWSKEDEWNDYKFYALMRLLLHKHKEQIRAYLCFFFASSGFRKGEHKKC